MITAQQPPESRRSLRERRQVNLTITSVSYRDWNRVYDCNCDLALVSDDDDEKTQDEEEYYTPLSSPALSLTEANHLVEIMEGLYIALADDEADVCALRTFDDEPFTHVVQFSNVMPSEGDGLALSNQRIEGVSSNALAERLCLVYPGTSHSICPERAAVGSTELNAARDFLTLVLPHGSAEWWPEELRNDEQGMWSGYDERAWAQKREDEQDGDGDDGDAQFIFLAPDIFGPDELPNDQVDRVDQTDITNALIVAPTNRAADVLSVLFYYLAFLDDITLEDLVEMDYYDNVWEEVAFGWWSVKYANLIARLWRG